MSFLRPTVTNPAANFYEWRSGQLSRYDKDKKENIAAKLPFEFIVLEELTTITGFHEPSSSGFYSNEVRFISKQPLHVKAFKGGPIADGLYGDIKDKVKSQGGKYTRAIYIAEKLNAGYVISHIKFSGAAFSAWLDFSRTCNVENGKVTLTGSVEDKKGATTFRVPTFTYSSLTKEEFDTCLSLAKDLDAYLNTYLDKEEADADEPALDSQIDPNLGKATLEQIAQFEQLKAEKLSKHTGEGPDDIDQLTYNRQAIDEIFGDDTPSDEPLPEYRG